MKLIFNMIGGPHWVGGQLYMQNLVKCVQATEPSELNNIQIDILVHSGDMADYAANGTVGVRQNGWQWRFTRLVYAALGIVLPPQMRQRASARPGTFFYPNVDGRMLPYATAGWIPDFQHVHMPELFSQKELRNRDKVFARMADNLSLVFVSSEMARQDFVRLYPHAASKVKTLKFASIMDATVLSGDHAEVTSRYGLPECFFLVCNQLWKHKDHMVVIDALIRLKEHGITLTVACTGAMHDYRNPDYPAQISRAIQTAGLENQVKLLGFIPRADQLQLMRSCQAVIQPSRFEGWSTVVEDARTLGKPIVISDFTVHLEQAHSGAIFFPVGDSAALAECLRTASQNLPAGPDVVREKGAFDATRSNMREIGRVFLNAVSTVAATN